LGINSEQWEECPHFDDRSDFLLQAAPGEILQKHRRHSNYRTCKNGCLI